MNGISGAPAAHAIAPTATIGLAEAPERIRVSRVPNVLLELVARGSSAFLLGTFAWFAIVHWRADPARITLLLLVVAECLTVGLALFARVPVRRDWTPIAFVCAICGTYYFLAIRLTPGVRLVPETVGATLQVIGIGWQLAAKATLRASFGILPANRGVVSGGPYRLMRHPMYFGYFVTDLGFLLTSFGLWNLVVYGVQFALQAGRIVREERLLAADPNYRAYKARVKFRVLPGLF
ncbi:methyltransferase family protein [Paraburkholderia phosphatilytica]|uniref:methyltransferase family protein n=1 Tax=Paraburkholderia phosphatilytica TaxID=2282883 RepID=UPI000E4740E0|nr:methyltransferase [Paraburkholderia phosphatilytica]